MAKNKDPPGKPSTLDLLLYYGEEHEKDKLISEYLDRNAEFSDKIHSVFYSVIGQTGIPINSTISTLEEGKGWNLWDYIYLIRDAQSDQILSIAPSLLNQNIIRRQNKYPQQIADAIDSHGYKCDSCLNTMIYSQRMWNMLTRISEQDIIPSGLPADIFTYALLNAPLFPQEYSRDSVIKPELIDIFWGLAGMDSKKSQEWADYLIDCPDLIQQDTLVTDFIGRQVERQKLQRINPECPDYKALSDYVSATNEEMTIASNLYRSIDNHLLKCSNCLEIVFYEAINYNATIFHPLFTTILKETVDNSEKIRIIKGDGGGKYKGT
jgi:hypothetical protein